MEMRHNECEPARISVFDLKRFQIVELLNTQQKISMFNMLQEIEKITVQMKSKRL